MPVATAPLVPITGLDVFEMPPFLACLAIDMISVTIASNSLWLGKYRPSKSNTQHFFVISPIGFTDLFKTK